MKIISNSNLSVRNYEERSGCECRSKGALVGWGGGSGNIRNACEWKIMKGSNSFVIKFNSGTRLLLFGHFNIFCCTVSVSFKHSY